MWYKFICVCVLACVWVHMYVQICIHPCVCMCVCSSLCMCVCRSRVDIWSYSPSLSILLVWARPLSELADSVSLGIHLALGILHIQLLYALGLQVPQRVHLASMWVLDLNASPRVCNPRTLPAKLSPWPKTYFMQ